MGEVHHLNRDVSDDAIFSPEAEQQVLGAVLLDNTRSAAVAQAGGKALFHDPFHAALWGKIFGMERDGILASPVTLREWAAVYPHVDEYGGAAYLARLAGSAISPGMIDSYCQHLAELSARRTVLESIEKARTDILSGDVAASHVSSTLEASLLSVEGGSGPKPVSMMNAATAAGEAAWAAHTGDAAPGVPTGIGSLDGIVGGLFPGDMVLLGGRPSMGKTALAINVALNAARQGRKIAFCSLEMGPEAVAMRCLSESMAAAGRAVSYRDLRAGKFAEMHEEAFAAALEEVGSLPIMFLPRQFQDAGAMLAGAKRAKAMMKGLDLMIVDYVQLMKAAQARNRYETITEVSTAIKRMAVSLEVPVIALSQLSRAVEQRDDKRPRMDDLRESGQLEQDADTIMFCYRDEYYLEREQPADLDKFEEWQRSLEAARNRLEIIVAKQRQGGIGTARVFCNVALNRIWEAER